MPSAEAISRIDVPSEPIAVRVLYGGKADSDEISDCQLGSGDIIYTDHIAQTGEPFPDSWICMAISSPS